MIFLLLSFAYFFSSSLFYFSFISNPKERKQRSREEGIEGSQAAAGGTTIGECEMHF